MGVMSGTSADGVDLALAQVSGGGSARIRAKLLAQTTVPLEPLVRKGVLRVAENGAIRAGDLSQLNFQLGEVFAGGQDGC